jgi:hypothetical protein
VLRRALLSDVLREGVRHDWCHRNLLIRWVIILRINYIRLVRDHDIRLFSELGSSTNQIGKYLWIWSPIYLPLWTEKQTLEFPKALDRVPDTFHAGHLEHISCLSVIIMLYPSRNECPALPGIAFLKIWWALSLSYLCGIKEESWLERKWGPDQHVD